MKHKLTVPSPGEPFNIFFDPEVQQLAIEPSSNPSSRNDFGPGKSRARNHFVDAIERYGNRRHRVEKLVSAWNQGIYEDVGSDDGADDPLIDASAEPSKRPRTRLTDKEVDAMRTARAQGVSVNGIARQFGVHRGTVWVKTRELH